MRALEARIIRRLLGALSNEFAWLFIGMLTLAILWVWFVTTEEPWAGGLLK